MAHSLRLLESKAAPPTPDGPPDVDMRRAVSASYYALFHHLSEAAVRQIAPQTPPEVANRVHRWLDHAEMKRVCVEFARPHLRPPLRDLLGDTASLEMKTVATAFLRLQEARHSADYAIEYKVTRLQAQEFITMAVKAIGAWNSICPSAESNIFVLSLLLWKKWEIVRQ